jgi:excisionase family DNA binding protein
MKNSGIAPAVVSVDQAAIYIGVFRASIWRLMAAGTIAYVKVGGRRMIRLSVLDEVLAAGERRGRSVAGK